MPESQPVNIPIVSTADLTGFNQTAAKAVETGARLRELLGTEVAANRPVTAPVTAPGVEAVQSKLRDLTTEANQFTDALKLGIGINVGERIVETLAEVSLHIREAIEEGVQYNKELETLGIGLAAALAQAEPEKYGKNFNDALRTGGELLDIVKTKALELNVSTTSLAHTLQVSMLGLVEGGIKNLNEQVEVTGLLMQAAAAKGVTGFQAVRDIIDILNGKAERVILSRELGITNADISAAKKTGELAEYLTSKLGAYRDAAKLTGDSLAGLQVRFNNLSDAIKGEVTTPVFDALKDGLRELDETLADPTTVDGLRAIGFEVAGLVRTGAGLLNFAVQNAGALRLLAEGTAAYGAAVAAVKIKDLVIGLGAKVLGLQSSTVATERETAAVAADTAETSANTRAKLANAEASRAQAGAANTAPGSGGLAAGSNIAGAINAGVLAGVALNVLLTEIAASIDATTDRENKFGAAVEKANKSLIEQVRRATTPAEVDAARLAAQEKLVAASLALSKATNDTREGLESQVRTAQLLLSHFDEQVGTQKKLEDSVQKVTAEEAKRAQAVDAIAAKQKEILTTEGQLKRLQDINAPAFQLKVRQAQLDTERAALTVLQSALAIQGDLVAKAKERAGAEKDVVTALKSAAEEMDKQDLADQSKALQARAYNDALEETIRRIAQDTGLRVEAVRAIRDGNAAEEAGITLSEEKQKVLAGYLTTLRDARNASDKANDDLAKETTKQADAYDKAQKAVRDTNAEIAAQKVKLDDLAKSDRPNKEQEITTALKAGADALEKQMAALDEIKKIEDARKKSNEDLHPEATAARNKVQKALDDDKLQNRDYSDAELDARANARAALLAERNRQQAIIDAKANADTPGIAHDREDTTTPYGQGGAADDPSPPTDDAAQDIADAASNSEEADGKLKEAATKLADASGNVSTATETLPDNMQGLADSFTGYHTAVTDGITTIAGTFNDSVTSLQGVLTSALAVQQQQAGQIANLQSQFDNLQA